MSKKEIPNENSIKKKDKEQELDSQESSLTETLETKTESEELSIEELKELLSKERQKVVSFEDKLKHTLADYQNLQRKISLDIENGVKAKTDQLMLDFLQIYDDFIRAKNVFSENEINTEGLNSILKNMDGLLSKNHITSIDSIGEIFDPKIHEAISIIEDPSLDENTITNEIRKGYISHNRVIRPALVEISKKSK